LTGSFTGYRPILELGEHYLSASESFKQPLCGNEEGWGPLSPFRYDFTPCFVDVWVFAVAVFGLICGPLAVWYVLRRQKALSISKDWHFWTKQVSMGTFNALWLVAVGKSSSILTTCCI
jgi:ATP-binding cassette, subfamily C (CFTR/MRP), member 1